MCSRYHSFQIPLVPRRRPEPAVSEVRSAQRFFSSRPFAPINITSNQLVPFPRDWSLPSFYFPSFFPSCLLAHSDPGSHAGPDQSVPKELRWRPPPPQPRAFVVRFNSSASSGVYPLCDHRLPHHHRLACSLHCGPATDERFLPCRTCSQVQGSHKFVRQFSFISNFLIIFHRRYPLAANWLERPSGTNPPWPRMVWFTVQSSHIFLSQQSFSLALSHRSSCAVCGHSNSAHKPILTLFQSLVTGSRRNSSVEKGEAPQGRCCCSRRGLLALSCLSTGSDPGSARARTRPTAVFRPCSVSIEGFSRFSHTRRPLTDTHILVTTPWERDQGDRAV